MVWEGQLVIQGLMKKKVLLLFLLKGGGDYTPYIPGSDGPETRKKYTVHSVDTSMIEM